MYTFEIYGDPVPQKQTRFSRGRAYNPSSHAEVAVRRNAAPFAPNEPLLGAVKVDLTFVFCPPSSVSQKKRRLMLEHKIHHIKRPDADNCAYLITNALKGLFYKDDSQIIRQNHGKEYGEYSKTIVTVTPIEEEHESNI